MSEADKLFKKEYGLDKIIDDEDTIRYLYKDDFKQLSIDFRVKLHDYHISEMIWIPKDSETWNTMLKNNKFRNNFDKHCAAYGHWEMFYHYTSVNLHRIINIKMKELGWTEE